MPEMELDRNENKALRFFVENRDPTDYSGWTRMKQIEFYLRIESYVKVDRDKINKIIGNLKTLGIVTFTPNCTSRSFGNGIHDTEFEVKWMVTADGLAYERAYRNRWKKRLTFGLMKVYDKA